MAKKKIKTSDPELRQILSGQIQNALGYLGGQLSQIKKKIN
jgi:spore coat protein CotF